MAEETAAADPVPGGQAEKPTDIPAAGWRQVVRRGWRESKADQVPLLAGGVAYAAFLALFPAMIAAISVYGLVADPAKIQKQIQDVASALPKDAQSVLVTQLSDIANGSRSSSGGAW